MTLKLPPEFASHYFGASLADSDLYQDAGVTPATDDGHNLQQILDYIVGSDEIMFSSNGTSVLRKAASPTGLDGAEMAQRNYLTTVIDSLSRPTLTDVWSFSIVWSNAVLDASERRLWATRGVASDQLYCYATTSAITVYRGASWQSWGGVTYPTTDTPEVWVFIGKADRTTELYINGTLAHTFAASGTADYGNRGGVGGRYSSTSLAFAGMMLYQYDVFSTDLSATDVADLTEGLTDKWIEAAAGSSSGSGGGEEEVISAVQHNRILRISELATYNRVQVGELQGVTISTRLPDIRCRLAQFKAAGDNPSNVYLGCSCGITTPQGTTNTTTGYELRPGDKTPIIPVSNLNHLYRICDSVNDKLLYRVLD